jgi:hypothetical protein
MRQRMRPLSELDGFHSGLVEQNRPVEHIHRRRVQSRTKVDESPTLRSLALDDRGSSFAGEPGGMEEVVIEENSDGSGPFEGGERSFHRAAEGLIEGQEPRRLAGPENEVRQSLRTIAEGADD